MRMVMKSVVSHRVKGMSNLVKVRAIFSKRKIKIHTHKPKVLLPFSIIMEGLFRDYTLKEIKSFVGAAGIRMEIVGLSEVSNLDAIYKLKTVLKCKVHFRKDRDRDNIHFLNARDTVMFRLIVGWGVDYYGIL